VAGLSVSRDAKRDLGDIFLYIARDSVGSARRMLALFHEKFQAIAIQPGIGRMRDEIKAGYQSHAVGNYVIYYRQVKGTIRILRVVHGARDIEKLFKV
jgi:toxin ParE1/3/4